MTIGSMSQRLTLQKKVVQDNFAGGRSSSYEDIETVFASVRTQPKGTDNRGGQLDFQDVVVFTIHYQPANKQAERLLWDGQVYDIISVIDPDLTKRRLEFRARASRQQ